MKKVILFFLILISLLILLTGCPANPAIDSNNPNSEEKALPGSVYTNISPATSESMTPSVLSACQTPGTGKVLNIDYIGNGTKTGNFHALGTFVYTTSGTQFDYTLTIKITFTNYSNDGRTTLNGTINIGQNGTYITVPQVSMIYNGTISGTLIVTSGSTTYNYSTSMTYTGSYNSGHTTVTLTATNTLNGKTWTETITITI